MHFGVALDQGDDLNWIGLEQMDLKLKWTSCSVVPFALASFLGELLFSFQWGVG